MSYTFVFSQKCEKQVIKLAGRNPTIKEILSNKINEIILNPHHYKPLRNALAGERRVHINKSLVLKFIIEENAKRVVFIFLGHHDEAYSR